MSNDVCLLRVAEVSERVGIKRAMIYALMAEGRFPRPVKIGFASRWRSDEIAAWIDARSAERAAA